MTQSLSRLPSEQIIKYVFAFLIIIVTNCQIIKLKAQAPQTFPYQAVARDVSGNLISNQTIALRFSILNASNIGTVAYQETQMATTNSLGLFNVNIGQGTVTSGTFATINWATSTKYLKVELDIAGGNNYTVMGTTQLMSVPYALNAEKSNDNVWTKTGNNITNSNSGNVGIGVLSPTSKLHTVGSVRHEGLSGGSARIVRVDEDGILFTAQSPIISTPNTTISDNGCANGTGVTNSITLSGYPNIVASYLVSVKVNITHTYDADVALFLIAPNGAILKLAQNNGGSGDNFTNTVFADNASTSISIGTAPFTGSFKPIGGTAITCTITPTVSTFGAIGGGGVNPNGVWTLKVIDDANGDVGVLNNWSVEVQGYSNGGINNYVPKWENGALTNTSTIYDNGTFVGIGTTSPTAKLHTTGTVRHESLQGEGKRIVYADSNGYLQASAAPTFASTVSTVMNNVSFPQCYTNSILVSGMPTSIPSNSITITISITIPSASAIAAYLEAPNGQKLNLTDGSNIFGSDMLNSVFTDQSMSFYGSTSAPHSGVFIPRGTTVSNSCVTTNVTSFGGFGSGNINPNGTWKLWVRNNSLVGANIGSINNWSISFGDTVNNGYTNYIPKWTSAGLKNSSLIYDNGAGVSIGTTSTYNNLLTVMGDASIYGNLGVGETSPQAPLHVSSFNGVSTPNSSRAYFNATSGSSIVTNTNVTNNIQIQADGWIWANGGGFVATSDKRIKNILSKTNTKNDLDVLNKIDITNYKYIDEISNGSKPQKKVIAQQVQGIYPIAVNTSRGIIPNVFETALCTEVKNGKTFIETKKQHDFVTGDEVKLILATKGEKTFKVKVVNENLFTIDEIINENIFVYGKKVNDLLTVDYDALTTLNISATQQLSKQVDELLAENEILKKQYKVLESKINQVFTSSNIVSGK